jgi:hypothetical protein
MLQVPGRFFTQPETRRQGGRKRCNSFSAPNNGMIMPSLFACADVNFEKRGSADD